VSVLSHNQMGNVVTQPDGQLGHCIVHKMSISNKYSHSVMILIAFHPNTCNNILIVLTQFMYGALLDGLYWDFDPSGILEINNNGYIYYTNRKLGVPIVRLLRVRNNTCPTRSSFGAKIPYCYAEYSTDNADTDPIPFQSPSTAK